MTDTETAEVLEQSAIIEQNLAKVAKLTKSAARHRGKAEDASRERTELVGLLVEAGVPLAQIAKRAGVTRGALQWRAKA